MKDAVTVTMAVEKNNIFTVILHGESDFNVEYFAEHQTIKQIDKALYNCYGGRKLTVVNDPRKIECLIYIDGIWRGSIRNEKIKYGVGHH